MNPGSSSSTTSTRLGGRTAPGAERVVIDNRTGLPDTMVEEAVQAHFVEHASVLGLAQPSFSTYDGGSLMNRTKFKVPTTVQDEIKLARDLAERDDDVGAVIGQMIGTAFGDGMENFHADEPTTTLFNQLARKINMDGLFAELYREWLIAQQFTTVQIYGRDQFEYTPEGGDGRSRKTYSLAWPNIAILPSEYVVPLGSTLFASQDLAYDPVDTKDLSDWLKEFFAEDTTPARKNELRQADPVAAALFLEEVDYREPGSSNAGQATKVYRLNPKMAQRTTGPRGSWAHPRPLLTRSFGLLEAKRLLNLMDHALLQGGINFIVVAKKGSDQKPAKPEEIRNLGEVVQRASRSGVIVGDHRLSFEVITPNMDALLSPARRKLLGRKLAQALLRIPETLDDAGGEAIKAELEFIARSITFDRRQIKRHVENAIYEEIVNRNRNSFKFGSPKLWFPKIVLSGTNYFTDYVIKLRDRGDIPRKWAVEAGGFDYEAGLAQREREVARGDDDTLAPAAVPFTDPATGPQDNNEGRPSGTSPNNGRPGATPGTGQDPAAPKKTVTRNAGETVRAFFEEEQGAFRMGDLTHALLEQYDDTAEIGRLTALEREAIDADEQRTVGPLAVVPVAHDPVRAELRAIRLAPGATLITGERQIDGAVVTVGLCFRQPEFDTLSAQETAMQWGFTVGAWPDREHRERAREPDPAEEHARELPAPQPVIIQVPGQKPMRLVRDNDGNIVGTEPVDADA